MNIKRTGLILFLVALMVLGLVACGVTTPTTQPGTDTPTQPAKDTVSVVFMVNGEQYKVETVEKGQKVTAPTEPAYAGQEFLGWFKADATEKFDFNTAVDAALVLTAKFAYTKYTITYNVVEEDGVIADFDASKVTNPNASTVEYTTEAIVKFGNATYEGNTAFVGTWVDESGNTVTSTEGLTGNLTLTTKWIKAPYIDLNFEGLQIHYADSLGEDGKTAIDGTKQGQTSAALVKPNLYILSNYETKNGVLILDFAKGTNLLEAFKNSNNPAYIRNDGDAHGNYFCVVLDKDLTDGSQNEANYDDKKGEKQHTPDGKKFFEGVSSVYYCFSNGEPYNVGIICRTQNNSTATGNVKLSFDFYFEEGGIFPLSFYIRGVKTSKGQDRANLAALKPNGEIAIGVDAAGNKDRMAYVDANGAYIETEQVLGDGKKAVAGKWNTIEFVMTLQDSGTNYSVDITLNGDTIATDLNLKVDGLTWDKATMFMIFGGGGSVKVENLPKDIVYKFDNIKLVDAD